MLPPGGFEPPTLVDNKRLPGAIEVAGFFPKAMASVFVEAAEAAAFLTLLVFVTVQPPALVFATALSAPACAPAVIEAAPEEGVSFGELLPVLQSGRFFAAMIEVGLEVLLLLEVWFSNRLASV